MLNLDVSLSCLEIAQSTLFKNDSMNTIVSLKQLTTITSNTKLDENNNMSEQNSPRNQTKFDILERNVMVWFISKGIKEGYPEEIM